MRRARQIAQLVREAAQNHSEPLLGEKIEARYAPDLNDRFVRITRKDGVMLYLSPSRKIEASTLPALPPGSVAFAGGDGAPGTVAGRPENASDRAPVAGDRRGSYLVETGAPMDEVQADLRQWLLFLLALLPVVAAVAVGGGYVLVKRALSARGPALPPAPSGSARRT